MAANDNFKAWCLECSFELARKLGCKPIPLDVNGKAIPLKLLYSNPPPTMLVLSNDVIPHMWLFWPIIPEEHT